MSGPIRLATKLGQIECDIRGDGPTLLALHGGMGGYDQSRLLARALLADPSDHRVISMSRPGYLGTSLEVGRSPEQQADAMAELLDHVGVKSAALAAVSAGGPSALQFAIRHPQRCRALILVSACTGRLHTPGVVLSRLKAMRLIANIPGLSAFLSWRAKRNPDAAAERAIPDEDLRTHTMSDSIAGPLLRELQASIFHRLAERIPGTVNDILQFAALPPVALNRIVAPTLIIHGLADDIVAPSHAQAAATGISGAELLAIEGAGHVALFTHLAHVRSRVAGFIAA